MNYASVITGGIALLAMIWYFIDGRRHYHGPRVYIGKNATGTPAVTAEGDNEKDEKSSVDDKGEGITVLRGTHVDL
ncbi:hypothetical protein EDB85DRAFT_2144378 [Lactarius pseudohatsudake]|nr:hypothetical protein EDB85DRAFT_2144378 [Lactarius pseudohatsudake]